MKKILCHICIMLVALICFSANGYALEFKAGIYYFDNSKLKFNNVKMVLGNDYTTYVYDMVLPDNDGRHKGRLNQDLSDLTGFCFIESDTMPGTYNKGLQFFIHDIASSNPNFRQTKIRTDIKENVGDHSERIIGWVFCPLNDAPKSDGYWRPLSSYGVEPSRTVPLVHINTQDSMPIVTKDYYINGQIWIENCDIEGIESFASEDEPLVIEIKGRGGTTWANAYKKPYKIKLSRKGSPFGLDNSKHFILAPRAFDYDGYVRNTTGFELSRLLEMDYTPSEVPVELVLNGEYMGLYFFGENIRVENGRVEIIEQIDYDTNPYNVTGGWLLENRGYDNPVHQQWENNDPSKTFYAFESKSPENFSPEQQSYISTFISEADSCIFVADKTDTGWEQYFDISSLARFYVIQEVLENTESFDGSLYMYKDWGEDEKLHFGPVWDFDSSFYDWKHGTHTTSDNFIYNYDHGFRTTWIDELCKFPHLQQEIKKVWKDFKNKNCLEKLITHMHEFQNIFKDAKVQDFQRWPTYGSKYYQWDTDSYIDRLTRKVAWLDEQWTVPVGDVDCDGHVNAVDVTIIYNYLLNGDETFKYTCDVNGDGHVNSVDITTIYDILLNQN